MNITTLSGHDAIKVSIGGSSGFIMVDLPHSYVTYELIAPCFEIDGKQSGGAKWEFAGETGVRDLANGGRETSCLFRVKNLPVALTLIIRSFPGSPFIRFRYTLESSQMVRLTKTSGKDNIVYSGLSHVGPVTVTELQFSQFDPLVHAFVPGFQIKTAADIEEGTVYPGPVTLLEGEDCCVLLAYEHGAEYPDSYLEFTASQARSVTALGMRARKGNYYSGQQIGPGHSFVSPWFHFATGKGSMAALLEQYRLFFLEYICENTESRKPYIFYNTWNNQERNKYYHHLPYLHSMNLEHTLAEIDIAARMGVDVFVIDTGWYIKTGDWVVNAEFFPDGLQKVKHKLQGYGMKLGLWFNPIVAAETSDMMQAHPEYRMNLNGKDSYWGKIWETEESWGMCLASGYSDHFIDKMVELNRTLGVTYFKWDAIGQYGCNSSLHHHGNEQNDPQERLDCYSFQMGLEMIRIVEEVHRQCPDVIVDFDITEGARFVGLGFLSVGKYFLMNNGPYYASFDIPAEVKHEPDTINVFFFPGAARARVCRQGIRFDSFIPSILFLTHFLPDKPAKSQNNALASLMLGGNGIWGDLSALDEDDIGRFSQALRMYKQVSSHATGIGAKTTGFIGSSPEIYDKFDPAACKGLVCFFTRAEGTFVYYTDKISADQFHSVTGADEYELTVRGRLKLTVILESDDARVVFIQ